MNSIDIDTNVLLQRLSEEAEKRNISLNALFVKSGVGKNFKSNLKTAKPSMGKITMLSVYLGVPVESLLGTAVDSEPTPEAEASDIKKELFDLIDKLDDAELAQLEGLANYLIDKKNKK